MFYKNSLLYHLSSVHITIFLLCNAFSITTDISVATQRKGPYVGKIKIEFCKACYGGYSAGHFGTKIMYLAQFLTELLRILSFKTCLTKN